MPSGIKAAFPERSWVLARVATSKRGSHSRRKEALSIEEAIRDGKETLDGTKGIEGTYPD